MVLIIYWAGGGGRRERKREKGAGGCQTERIYYLCADMCHQPQLLLVLYCQRLRERAIETEISTERNSECSEIWGYTTAIQIPPPTSDPSVSPSVCLSIHSTYHFFFSRSVLPISLLHATQNAMLFLLAPPAHTDIQYVCHVQTMCHINYCFTHIQVTFIEVASATDWMSFLFKNAVWIIAYCLSENCCSLTLKNCIKD